MQPRARTWPLVLLLVFALALLGGPRAAHAWTEAHHVGEVLRITLQPDGAALVETTARYDVVRGPMRAFDVTGIHPDAVLDGALHVERIAAAPLGPREPEQAADDLAISGRATVVAARRGALADDGAQLVRLSIDSAGRASGLPRGAYRVSYRYRLDATRLMQREGERLRLTFQAAVAPEGYDSARILVVVPHAPEPPRALEGGWGSAVSTLRRGSEFDELELLRPHVARGEAPQIVVEFDARALTQLARPDLRAAAPRAVPPSWETHWPWAAAALLAWLCATLCAKVAPARPMQPLVPFASRAWAIGVVMAASVVLEHLLGLAWALPALVAVLALALARPQRQPARDTLWVALPREQVRRFGRGAWRTPLFVVAGTAAVVGCALWLGERAAWAVAVRLAVLAPLWLAWWPQRTPWRLARLAKQVEAAGVLDVDLVRSLDDDEVRLRAQPKRPLQGFETLEIGASRAGLAARVLVAPGSAAAARLVSLWPQRTPSAGPNGSHAYVLFAPSANAGYWKRVLSVVAPAFGERRSARVQVNEERRRRSSPLSAGHDTVPMNLPAACG